MHFMEMEPGRLVELHAELDLHLFKITAQVPEGGIYVTCFIYLKEIGI